MAMNCTTSDPEVKDPLWPDNIRVIFDNTTPLTYDHGDRLPLYLWPAIDPDRLSIAEAESLVKELDKRGIGVISRWSARKKEISILLISSWQAQKQFQSASILETA